MNSRHYLLAVALSFLITSAAASDCPPGDRGISPLHREPPAYPQGAAMFCVEGEVRVRFKVAADGSILDPEIVSSEPPGVFDGEALATVSTWQYQPACRGGEAVISDATQIVLEFELDADLAASYDCPENLDPELAATLTEIAGWYALLADWLISRPGAPIPQILIPEVRDDHSGDERRVLVFHRDAIQTIAQFSPILASFSLERNLIRLLDFERAADDPELRETRALLDAISRDLASHIDAELEVWELIGSAYIELAQEIAFDSETRSMLVHPFLGDPGRELPFSRDAGTDHIDDLNTLVQLLSDSDWSFENGQVQFSQNSRQRQFERLLERIEQRNERLTDSYYRSMAGLGGT